jgi:hypothetical protein
MEDLNPRSGCSFSKPSSRWRRCRRLVSQPNPTHARLSDYGSSNLSIAVDIDATAGYPEFKSSGSMDEDPYYSQAAPFLSADSHDSEPETTPRAPPRKPPDLFDALSHVDASLWQSLSPIPRGRLWDEVVSSIQSALLSRMPATSGHCGEDAEEVQDNQGDSPTAADPSTIAQAGVEPDAIRGSANKRRRDVDSDGEDHGDNNGEQSKPPHKARRRNDLDARLLACPFAKMFPWIFLHKRCLGGWPDVNRLKYVLSSCPELTRADDIFPREHLYRQHLEPERCPRCYEPFTDANQLTQHQRLDPPCQVLDHPPTQGIDKQQLELLKKKKRGSEAEKCRRVYNILWPEVNDENLPCPCKYSHPALGISLGNLYNVLTFPKSRLGYAGARPPKRAHGCRVQRVSRRRALVLSSAEARCHVPR